MLQSIGLQRVGHDWVTEQQQQKSVTKIGLVGITFFKLMKDIYE